MSFVNCSKCVPPEINRHARAPVRFVPTVLCLFLLSLSACVNRETATITPGTELSKLQSFYVAKFEPDGRGINTLISDRLSTMGFSASTGLDSGRPETVDAVVTYRDKWMWDMTMYMLSLDITVRDPHSNYPLAVGNSFHTSLTRETPEQMVQEVLGNIFKDAQR